MITVEIRKDESGLIASIIVSGHSGYKEEGADIICSAASTLVYTAIGALDDLCGLSDFYRISADEKSEIFLSQEELAKGKESVSQIILQTTRIGFLQLEMSVFEDYGDQYVRVIEIIDEKLEV